MSAIIESMPRYSKHQVVRFAGGEGTITGLQPNSNTWAYTVQMPLGPEPAMGRIGYETTILLFESDIEAFLHHN